mmetsp:Transcript_29268/g.41434  ORF Transcript_29268/g.41434 Transcript_29268/m.41434 type:complete len:108 (-) Transcript_29268:51-374(-)
MFTNAFRQAARTSHRRLQSTATAAPKSPSQASGGVCTEFLTANQQYKFSEAWLSDPSAYPLLVVMGAAGLLVVGVSASCLAFSPDVRIDRTKRSSTLRDWGLPGYKA